MMGSWIGSWIRSWIGGWRAGAIALSLFPALAAAPRDAPTPLPGLSAPASAAVDSLGVPAIEAASEYDAYRIEGWYHARDRFGAMDLFRRAAAGELSELVGPSTLALDRERRVLGLRGVAERAFAALPEVQRLALEAYASGVNAGLAARERPPAEHAAFAVAPSPWRPEDSLLVILSLAWRLHEEALRETRFGPALAELPQAVAAFLLGEGGSDAPVAGPAGPDGDAVPMPGPEVLDLRVRPDPAPAAAPVSPTGPDAHERAPGSNAFAIAGERTRHGAALLAGDMHLGLAIPGVWYRIELAWPGTRLMGFSLPGVPGIVAGSNGLVAWTFTNLHGDFLDHVVIETDPADPSRHLVPGSREPFTTRTESIAVRGGPPESIAVRSTRWGPIVGMDNAGRPLSLRWTLMDEGGLNLDLLNLARARSVDEALDIAAAWAGPPQNTLVAGRDGRIGWTISGRLPRRQGFDGSVPRSWATGDCGWVGLIEGRERPRIVDPPGGFLVSANQRPLPDATVAALGTLWPSTDRARRIRERLEAVPPESRWDEPAAADLQLDTLVPRLLRWREIAIRAIDAGRSAGAGPDPILAALREPLAAWDGRADLDAQVVELLDLFRRNCARAMREAIAAAGFPAVRSLPLPDSVIVRLAESRPEHLLPPSAPDWDSFLREQLRAAAQDPRSNGTLRPWGEANRLALAHPLAANPLLAMRMRAPADPQPGHPLALRVATPSFGASQRMVVAPGHESEGLFAMPLGQSGDPLDGHFLDHHQSWIDGKAVPFRAGTPVATRRFGPPA
jgi:penicillin amidase